MRRSSLTRSPLWCGLKRVCVCFFVGSCLCVFEYFTQNRRKRFTMCTAIRKKEIGAIEKGQSIFQQGAGRVLICPLDLFLISLHGQSKGPTRTIVTYTTISEKPTHHQGFDTVPILCMFGNCKCCSNETFDCGERSVRLACFRSSRASSTRPSFSQARMATL